jgi:hypothetical protein
MPNLIKILINGAILSFLASLWLILALWVNSRIFLHDYPAAIQEKVPKKNRAEKSLTYVFGIPFMLLLLLGPFFSTLALKAHRETEFLILWLNAAGVVLVFNVVDWLILDWLIFCTLTPRFIIIPGSEGMVEYKDYRFHFYGFLKGTLFSIFSGLIIAGIVFVI